MSSSSEEEVNLNGNTTVPTIALLCMKQMASDAAWTTNTLVESYRRSYARAEAELQLIKKRITSLSNAEYIVSPARYYAALYPDHRDVEALAERLMEKDHI